MISLFLACRGFKAAAAGGLTSLSIHMIESGQAGRNMHNRIAKLHK